MDDIPFLDTNVLVRFLAQDHPDHLARSAGLIRRIELGEVRVRVSDTVVFETVFVIQTRYGWQRDPIRAALTAVFALEGVILPEKEIYPDVFDLYVTQPALSFADCYHAVLAKHLGCTEIISFDRGFDRIPGLTRVEPRAISR